MASRLRMPDEPVVTARALSRMLAFTTFTAPALMVMAEGAKLSAPPASVSVAEPILVTVPVPETEPE